MQRKYYRYDDMGPMAPKFGVPTHAQPIGRHSEKPSSGEIITPQPVSDQQDKQEPEGSKRSGILTENIFQNGKLLGRFETDDIILLCLVFLLLQNSDGPDWPLLLALGYIFLSDKDIKLF